MFERLVAGYVRLLKLVLLLLALAMIGMVFTNLVLRYGFSSGIAASEELSRWALVWSGFVGATIALIERRHLSVRLILDAVPRSFAHYLVLLGQFLSLAVMLFLLKGAFGQTLLNMSMSGPITGLPLGIALYSAGLFFTINACICIPMQIIITLKERATHWQEH